MSSRIMLPDGRTMEREYEKALVFDEVFMQRLFELLTSEPKAGVVLLYVLQNMNSEGECIISLDVLAKELSSRKEDGKCFSKPTVQRTVKVLKEKYSDLVTVSRYFQVSKFTVDRRRCFISRGE